MKINADFGARVAVHAAAMDWTPSPMKGVERKMLDRIGGEVARATSIVRYAPGSKFSPHTHDGGEEFLVLDGEFQDEHGDYPAGTYVRNPPTSRHLPGSAPGCTIFVKLWQFDPGDRRRIAVNTGGVPLKPMMGSPGIAGAAIFEDARETVRIEHWAPGGLAARTSNGGLEVLCLDGGFIEGGATFAAQSWLRLPAGASFAAAAGPRGCRLWVKEGHLRFVDTAKLGAPYS